MHFSIYFQTRFVYNSINRMKGREHMSDFGNILRLLRNEKELSQQELADELEISKSAINMYERGERQPNFETLEMIADYFNVDMDYLYGRTNIRKKIHFDNDGTEYITVSEDPDIRRIHRAREKMSEQEKNKMMQILELSFDDYFGDDFIDEDDD